MHAEQQRRIQEVLGPAVRSAAPLSGGCIAEAYRVDLEDGRTVVAKIASGRAALDIEGYMLRYLAEHSPLPVPAVHHAQPTLLIMDWIEGSSHFANAEQTHAAELLAALHAIQAPRFGLERDTLIGGLHQPNPWNDAWRDFFARHRLLFMATQAHRAGKCSAELLARLTRFAERLDAFLDEPQHPSLLHGDVWTTNVLAHRGRITAFIDPAIYYGHPEAELAFITLFNTFGTPFFERYHALRPIADGFFELRRDIYNLYPLLVHARLFGGGYAQSVSAILQRHGF